MRRVSDAHRAVVRRGFQPVSKRLADARVHQGDVWQVNGVARFVAATVGHDPAVLGVDDSAPVGGTAADGPRLGEDPPRVESGLAEKIRRGAEFGRGVGLGGCGHDCSPVRLLCLPLYQGSARPSPAARGTKCRCRWNTDCVASRPRLVMTFIGRSVHRISSAARLMVAADTSGSWAKSRTCVFGTIRVWPSTTGLSGTNATASGQWSGATIHVAVSRPATISQKMQGGMVVSSGWARQ